MFCLPAKAGKGSVGENLGGGTGAEEKGREGQQAI